MDDSENDDSHADLDNNLTGVSAILNNNNFTHNILGPILNFRDPNEATLGAIHETTACESSHEHTHADSEDDNGYNGSEMEGDRTENTWRDEATESHVNQTSRVRTVPSESGSERTGASLVPLLIFSLIFFLIIVTYTEHHLFPTIDSLYGINSGRHT